MASVQSWRSTTLQQNRTLVAEHWHADLEYPGEPEHDRSNAHSTLTAALEDANQNREALGGDYPVVEERAAPPVLRQWRVEHLETDAVVAIIRVRACVEAWCQPAVASAQG
jgi:hypothetical protein